MPPFPEAVWGPPPPQLSPEDKQNLPPAIASVLWSIVGPTIYAKATIGVDLPGWIVRDEDSLQVSWKLSPPSQLKDRKWDWLYTADLPEIGNQLSVAARADLEAAHTNAGSPVWMVDPASPGVLSYLPSRILRPRSTDWNEIYNTEPCGIRLPPVTADQSAAIVLFLNATVLLPGLLVTYVHNLDPSQVPTLMEALDEAGAWTNQERGLVWGIKGDTPLGQAWLNQANRETSIAKRGDNENLLGVAWYGKPENRGKIVDTQLWSCA
jgi:hypothetical protein